MMPCSLSTIIFPRLFLFFLVTLLLYCCMFWFVSYWDSEFILGYISLGVFICFLGGVCQSLLVLLESPAATEANIGLFYLVLFHY